MNRNTHKAWAVVQVERGFPAAVELFCKRRDAQAAEKRFRQRMNPDYDDCGLFGVNLAQLRRSGRVLSEST